MLFSTFEITFMLSIYFVLLTFVKIDGMTYALYLYGV